MCARVCASFSSEKSIDTHIFLLLLLLVRASKRNCNKYCINKSQKIQKINLNRQKIPMLMSATAAPAEAAAGAAAAAEEEDVVQH